MGCLFVVLLLLFLEHAYELAESCVCSSKLVASSCVCVCDGREMELGNFSQTPTITPIVQDVHTNGDPCDRKSARLFAIYFFRIWFNSAAFD